MRRDKHGIAELVSIVACLAVAVLLVGVHLVAEPAREPASRLDGWSISSDDGSIVGRWNTAGDEPPDRVRVAVYDGESLVYQDTVDGRRGEALFEGGEHGKLYSVKMTPIARNGQEGPEVEKSVLFLDYAKLPNIPVLTVNTASGQDPTFEIAKKPSDDLLGATITNNDFVSGEVTFTQRGKQSFSSKTDIKVRGNTSIVTSTGKYSYRLKMKSPYSIDGTSGTASKDWTLLNSGSNINNYVGDWIGDRCGMEWQPHMIFVNLMLNGDWKGTYCLTPTVCAQNAQDLVSKTGYLFESDAYWWAADGEYYRTANQGAEFAFTFKYPKMKSDHDKHIARLGNYMQQFEDRLYANDPSYRNYIDEDSFARWMLARDISGNVDGGGTNAFYYKKDFDTADPTSTKVKMGPLWDNDAIFQTWDGWSDSRGVIYFSELFGQATFADRYAQLWRGMASDLLPAARDMLNDLQASEGDALDESWRLESARWGSEIRSFSEQRDHAELWFEVRDPWICNELGVGQSTSASVDVSSFAQGEADLQSAVESSNATNGQQNVRGWVFAKATIQMSVYTIPGIQVGDRVYLANAESRPDIQASYGLASDEVGYYASLPEGTEGVPCIVDVQNKIIYR